MCIFPSFSKYCLILDYDIVSTSVTQATYYLIRCYAFQSSLPYVDVDMIIDATLFLWNRCKPYFQRVVSCNQESCRHVLNDKDCDKVISALTCPTLLSSL